MPISGVFPRLRVAPGEVREAGGIVQEREVEFPDWSIALLGNDDLGFAAKLGIVLLVDLFAKDKHNNVGVLLDGAGLAEIAELRTMVAAATFGSAAELGEGNYGNFEFLRQGF